VLIYLYYSTKTIVVKSDMTLDRSNAATTATEAVQLALLLAREAPRAAQGKRSIEADLPVLEVSRLA
jgi:hypothetical protein